MGRTVKQVKDYLQEYPERMAYFKRWDSGALLIGCLVLCLYVMAYTVYQGVILMHQGWMSYSDGVLSGLSMGEWVGFAFLVLLVGSVIVMSGVIIYKMVGKNRWVTYLVEGLSLERDVINQYMLLSLAMAHDLLSEGKSLQDVYRVWVPEDTRLVDSKIYQFMKHYRQLVKTKPSNWQYISDDALHDAIKSQMSEVYVTDGIRTEHEIEMLSGKTFLFTTRLTQLTEWMREIDPVWTYATPFTKESLTHFKLGYKYIVEKKEHKEN